MANIETEKNYTTVNELNNALDKIISQANFALIYRNTTFASLQTRRFKKVTKITRSGSSAG
jgi:hypothetical protein